MKQNTNQNSFATPSSNLFHVKQALFFTPETTKKLKIYEEILKKWQKSINLVSKNTINELQTRHFLDSAQIYPLIPADARTVVDMGSGAGFPGLVLAIMDADAQNRALRQPAGQEKSVLWVGRAGQDNRAEQGKPTERANTAGQNEPAERGEMMERANTAGSNSPIGQGESAAQGELKGQNKPTELEKSTEKSTPVWQNKPVAQGNPAKQGFPIEQSEATGQGKPAGKDESVAQSRSMEQGKRIVQDNPATQNKPAERGEPMERVNTAGLGSTVEQGEPAAQNPSAPLSIHLIESDTRKGLFMKEVIRQLGLTNVTVHTCRIEQAPPLSADVVTARALADTARLLAWARPMMHSRTVCLFLKGTSAAAELTGLDALWHIRLLPSSTAENGNILHIQQKGVSDGITSTNA